MEKIQATASAHDAQPLSDASERGPRCAPLGRLLGDSRSMVEMFATIARLARCDASVLIQGETGTGKELVAEALHEHSPRQEGPLVVCDLSALCGSLMESEIFGHRRGSFTGADRDRHGAFAQAHGGTLFLDEVGELDLSLQPRLLRALERRQIKPVGGESYIDVDVRVVAASNRDLAEEVRCGRFRADLYHRLAVVELHVPPLRERHADIVELARCFLAELSARQDSAPPELSPRAIEQLREHSWPGNVRELRNVVERAVSLAPDATVLEAHHFDLEGSRRAQHDADIAEYELAQLPRFKEAKLALLARWERDYLRTLMHQTEGNVSLAARQSGLARGHLHRLLHKHGLERAASAIGRRRRPCPLGTP